jgi:DNA-binding response OmpR family regulator
MPTRIMVVNDTQEILQLFREILTDEGYEAILYSFAIQDLEEIERVKPDLIILDYMFDQEQIGWQLLQKLKMYRPTASIPVIICTAAAQRVREMEGYLQSKAIGLVLKPFDIEDLLKAIDQALRTYQDTAEFVTKTPSPDDLPA